MFYNKSKTTALILSVSQILLRNQSKHYNTLKIKMAILVPTLWRHLLIIPGPKILIMLKKLVDEK